MRCAWDEERDKNGKREHGEGVREQERGAWDARKAGKHWERGGKRWELRWRWGARVECFEHRIT